jgi:exodeoxyribonuclease VII small subunit
MGKSSRNAGRGKRGRGVVAEEQPESASGAVSFESALGQLEGTVSRLEEGEMPLEEALELFESGVKLSRQCSTTLEEAERRIEILVADRGEGENPEAVAFESEEDWDEDQDDQDDED